MSSNGGHESELIMLHMALSGELIRAGEMSPVEALEKLVKQTQGSLKALMF